ncbi:MAG: hypothetical protein ACPL7B_05125 [Candidatus Poribacteria bacterium]
MKRLIVFIILCIFYSSTISICQDKNLSPEWVFDNKDEIKNWGGLNQLQPLVVDTVKNAKGEKVTVLKTVSIGSDPYVFPDGNWNGFLPGVQQPFDGKKYPIIYIGVRVNVSSTWQIYYVTDQDAVYSERQRQNFQVNASDDFVDLQFKMTEGGWQEEEIRGFRLDPGTIAGVEAEIDYLSLRGIPGGKPKAVDYASKLAITWGYIKK